ncbi:MAG: hypothetical protein IPH35_24590 [Rhodoferax sp.]|nr:hypothetical protein [Rhodoferax sp.]
MSGVIQVMWPLDLAPSPQRGEGWGEGAAGGFALEFHIARDITHAKTAMQNPLASLCGIFLAKNKASNKPPDPVGCAVTAINYVATITPSTAPQNIQRAAP